MSPTTTLLSNPSLMLYIIALLAFASLTMSQFTNRQSKPRNSPPSTSIAQTIARYVSRKTSLSPRLPHHQILSSSPLLPRLPSRQPTLPGFDDKATLIDMRAVLHTHIHTLATTYSRSTYLGYSTYATPSTPSLYGRHKRLTSTLYLGLICRLNPTSGSLSVRLHPEDATTVVLVGWGQLAGSRDEVIIPAARDEHDLAVQMQILQAAVGYICKGEVEEGEDMQSDGEESVVRPQWLLPRYVL
jgi:hypothetical protein